MPVALQVDDGFVVDGRTVDAMSCGVNGAETGSRSSVKTIRPADRKPGVPVLPCDSAMKNGRSMPSWAALNLLSPSHPDP
jgi:hypothetical protein